MPKNLYILNDTHIGVRNNHPLFLDEVTEVFSLLGKKVTKDDSVIILGDVFDNRTAINLKAMNLAKDLFETLASQVKEIIITLGNHDIHYTNTLTPNSVWPLLSHISNLRIVDTYEEYVFGEKSILLVPWIVPSAIGSFAARLKSTRADYCFGHFDIQGFKFNKVSVNDKHGCSPTIFHKFEKVLSGHYHIASAIGNIEYLGTQYQMTWDDFGESKFITVMNEKGDFSKIGSGREVFKSVSIDDALIGFQNCFVKLNAKSTHTVKDIRDAIEKLTKQGAVDVKVSQTFNNNLDVETAKVLDTLTQSASIKEVISGIAADIEVDESFDQKLVHSLMQEILDEAFEVSE